MPSCPSSPSRGRPPLRGSGIVPPCSTSGRDPRQGRADPRHQEVCTVSSQDEVASGLTGHGPRYHGPVPRGLGPAQPAVCPSSSELNPEVYQQSSLPQMSTSESIPSYQSFHPYPGPSGPAGAASGPRDLGTRSGYYMEGSSAQGHSHQSQHCVQSQPGPLCHDLGYQHGYTNPDLGIPAAVQYAGQPVGTGRPVTGGVGRLPELGGSVLGLRNLEGITDVGFRIEKTQSIN